MSTKRIYLDNAATTPIDPRVLKEVVFHLKNTFGNAGSIHGEAVKAKKVLEESRKKVAGFLSGHQDEVFFTSGGTESNNLAILGIFSRFSIRDSRFKNAKKLHAITSAIEHSSVLKCFRELEKKGIEVTYLPVDLAGIVDLSMLKKSLRPETILVSIQYANNEIGVTQPIREIAKMIRNFGKTTNYKLQTKNFQKPIFHCDASQAAAYLDCNVERLGVDLLTLDGHKIYGPKGIGALYIRRDVSAAPIMFGGDQEGGIRPGTQNVPLIVGLAKALEICIAEREKEFARLSKLRNDLYSDVLKNIRTEVVLNGGMDARLPNNLNISIKDVDTEFLTLQLDAKGIAVSTKSACLSSDEGSYVVNALGGEKWRAKNTLRISLGRLTTKNDCQKLLQTLKECL